MGLCRWQCATQKNRHWVLERRATGLKLGQVEHRRGARHDAGCIPLAAGKVQGGCRQPCEEPLLWSGSQLAAYHSYVAQASSTVRRVG